MGKECTKAKKEVEVYTFIITQFEAKVKACKCEKPKPTPEPKPEPPTCDETLEENKKTLKEMSEKLKKLGAEFANDCPTDKRRLQAPTPAPVKPDVCDEKKATLEKLTQDTKDLLAVTKALACYDEPEIDPPVEKKTCEELLKIRADQKHKIHVLTVSKQQVCDKKRRLQAPTPPPAKPDVKPAPIDIEYNCKSVEYSLKKRQFALDDVIQELKKKKCSVPEDPKPTCQEQCDKDNKILESMKDDLEKKKTAVTKSCEAEKRRLQAPTPTPAPKLETKECTKAKKEVEVYTFIITQFEAKVKACKCEKPKPTPEPKPEPPTCDETLEENKKTLKEMSEKLKKLGAEFANDCPTDKRRLQAPTPAPVKPDVCDEKKATLEKLTQDTKDLLAVTKALACYDEPEIDPPVEKKTCEELLKIRADQKHKIHVLTVSKQQVCDKKRRLQAPTPPPAKPDVKPAPIDIEYNCKS